MACVIAHDIDYMLAISNFQLAGNLKHLKIIMIIVVLFGLIHPGVSNFNQRRLCWSQFPCLVMVQLSRLIC